MNTGTVLDHNGNIAVVKAHYDAAASTVKRSNIPGVLQGPKRDITPFTRKELARKARYLHKNSPFIHGIVERFVTFVVGSGLTPVPATKSKRWNERAKKAWKRWEKNCCVDSRLNFKAVQKILFRSAILDGDIFSLLTFGESGRRRIQIHETHRFGNPVPRTGDERFHDGVELDYFGRPSKYHFIIDERLGLSKTEAIDTEDIVQHFFPERSGQHRGVTALASAINTAHDIDDILILEKEAVKTASSKEDIIKTKSGELERSGLIGNSVRSEDNGDDAAVNRYYRETYGTEAIVLRTGDEFDQYVSNRPSPAWQGFMDFLSNTVCLSLGGMPPSTLLPIKVGGADTRKDLDIAERIISGFQEQFASQLQRIWEYVIEDEFPASELHPDYKETEWQFPQKMTADAGRERKADLEDVKAGLMSRREFFGRWGQDWQEQMDQIGEEAAHIKKLAEKHKVKRGEIALIDANELSANGSEEPAAPQPKQEEKEDV